MATNIVPVEQCKVWEKSGKSDFIQYCKSRLAVVNSRKRGSKSDVKRALYEIIWHVIKGSLKQDQALLALQDIVDHHGEISSVVADIFSITDVEMGLREEKISRDRFLNLLGSSTVLVPEAILKERLEGDTLENSGLMDSRQNFQAKYVKIKTKLYYKQQKFNLLREESEGYSKLITELNQDFTDDLTPGNVLQNIRSLIGCFNLDPNRVLDIILESFECRPNMDSFFVQLLAAYTSDREALCHILGFKFHFYQQPGEGATAQSLYKMAALLLFHKLVDLEALYGHLVPSDSDITEGHQRESLEAKNYARKLSVVVLAEKNNDKEKEKAEKEDKEKEKEKDMLENQKIGLCEALLRLGDWQNAKRIMDWLPPFCMASQMPISLAMCDLIHHCIEPIYRLHSGLPKVVMQKRKSSTNADMKAIEQVDCYEKMMEIVFPMLSYLGPHIAIDTLLMGKVIRLAKAFMEKRSSEPNPALEDVFYGFLTVMDEVILPSLSMQPGNCCMSEDIWSFLKLLKYEHRYRLYGQWKNDSYSAHPKLVRVRADCIDRAKYIMKRLAKENVKLLGRQIGKLSHSNPAILFEYILSQIQKYDNFIGPVVDSLKYLTSLSYDILAYCILEALANPEKERLKHDDTNISLWLQSLASFSGAVFKKYPIELGGLMQYVANQLKAGKSYDLLILREVVQKMAGVETSEEMTDDQIAAMGGGELLRQEGGYFAQVRNTKRSSTRLRDALTEHDLAIPMCILMSQQKASILYTADAMEDTRHIKLIGKLYDGCQDTFVQFISFLTMQLSVDDIGKRLPPIDVMLSTYHVAPEAAFALARMIYSNSVNSKFEELKKLDKKKDKTPSSQSQRQQRFLEAVTEVMVGPIESVRMYNPFKVWDDLSPQFYTTFWSLSMYDLLVPTGAYEKQAQVMDQQMDAIENSKDMNPSKKKKERERCQALKDKLSDEEKKQHEHVKLTLARLEAEKESWFMLRTPKNVSVTAFLQYCVFPRCLFTAIDAVYCAKFLHILHNLKTPNFSSLLCYDRIFSDVTFSMTSCTESEAHRYGRFLCTALDTIMRWHSDRHIYEKECGNYPGFMTVFRAKDRSVNKNDQLDYENYRHVCHKWQFSLTKAMVACLQSGCYIQIRNALIVLIKILPHYPKLNKFGQALERRVEKLCVEEKEKRPDIYALAMGYSGQLKAKKRFWLDESQFHLKDKEQKKAAAQTVSSASGSKSENAVTVNGTDAKKETDDKKKNGKEDQSDSKATVKAEAGAIKTEKRGSPSKGGASSSTDKKSEKASASREKHGTKEKSESKKEEKIKIKKERPDKEDKAPREKEEKVTKERRVLKEEKSAKEEKEERSYREDKQKDGKEEKVKSHSREDRKEGERSQSASSSQGSGAGHRRSAEPSPKHDDRENKRRKIEAPSSKSPSHDRGSDVFPSPSYDRHEREKEEKRSYKEAKKRDRTEKGSQERESVEIKRYREDPSPSRRSLNGDSQSRDRQRSPKEHERSYSREHDDLAAAERAAERAVEKASKKTSKKDGSDKKADKHSKKSSKK